MATQPAFLRCRRVKLREAVALALLLAAARRLAADVSAAGAAEHRGHGGISEAFSEAYVLTRAGFLRADGSFLRGAFHRALLETGREVLRAERAAIACTVLLAFARRRDAVRQTGREAALGEIGLDAGARVVAVCYARRVYVGVGDGAVGVRVGLWGGGRLERFEVFEAALVGAERLNLFRGLVEGLAEDLRAVSEAVFCGLARGVGEVKREMRATGAAALDGGVRVEEDDEHGEESQERDGVARDVKRHCGGGAEVGRGKR